MNILRNAFKKTAENNVKAIDADLGDLLNKIWEVVRVSSLVIDNCLKVQSILDDIKLTSLLLITRNLLSDCCCCLDALERGHERTIFNNLRMILEDLFAVIEASSNNNVFKTFLEGKHKASKSLTFVKKHYPTHEFDLTYGWLSKISHHMHHELIVRQWVNRDGLITHIKPYNLNQRQAQLRAFEIVTHLTRFAGEIAEELCLDELMTPYFWTKKKERHPSTAIDIVITEITNKIDEMMHTAEVAN